MLHFASSERIIMATQAKWIALGDEQFGVRRLMRAVATLAIAFGHGLMFDFAGDERLAQFFVTGETGLARLARHLLRIFRFMARRAITLGVRLMDIHLRRQRADGIRGRRRIGDQRLRPPSGQGVGRAGLGNAVKE